MTERDVCERLQTLFGRKLFRDEPQKEESLILNYTQCTEINAKKHLTTIPQFTSSLVWFLHAKLNYKM